MSNSVLYIGLDVHKDSIEIAVAESGRDAEVRHYERTSGELAAFDKAVHKLRSTGHTLRFVYEAGPCGYVIYRHLTKQGLDCTVVSPSLIPRKPGERIKTDRRDALKLARSHRAGDLTAVYVPTEADEAMRDLVRAREDAKQAEIKARQQLLAFLLRHDCRYSGKCPWTAAHTRWLSELKLPHPAQRSLSKSMLRPWMKRLSVLSD